MKLGVVLLTYSPAASSPRTGYADKTLRALLKHLTADEMHFHIADDGSYSGHVKHLKDLITKAGYSEADITVTNAERGGYGRSYNLATQMMHEVCENFLMVEDDWQLTRDFDPDDLIRALQDNPSELGCIRLGYLGRTQKLSGSIEYYSDQTFLQFDPGSPEPHVWTGHPRLESRAFQRRVGAWPEGLDAGSTEMVISKREESRHGVAWPMDIAIRAGQIHGTLFAHIGEVTAKDEKVAI